ncbi:hypothetical protein [Croceicoccus marinus]|uniref:Uncharacterized protein n=1 Tax=Croceicoccus marinus TaxID=450378 RepID=A0A7G6W1A2_9SPHN|nr:hypothetical protein [Croceicoccus marinus]QNE07767.1 hypothetical protein H4O24_19665 [Croceicoccus marinus]
MASITPLSSGRGLPDLTMVEFAIMISLMRLGPNPAPLLLETLSEWFGQTVGLSDLKPGLRRLMHQGMLVQDSNGALRPMPPSATPVATCFAAAIRIVGTEFRRALDKGDPPLIDHILRQAREDARRDEKSTPEPDSSPGAGDEPPPDKE